MGGGAPSPPPPPDPKETSAAQTSTNVATAIANQQLSAIDQETPLGTLTYLDNGSYTLYDPIGERDYDVPKLKAVTEYTPIGQEITDTNTQTQLNLSKLGESQSSKLNDLLSRPMELDNEATEARIIELQRKRMDPLFMDKKAHEENRLAQQGIKRGSDAYDQAMSAFDRSQNDAYTQMLLAARGQAINEQLTERNQPLNEIAAMLSGSQVQQPQFQSTPSFNMPVVDHSANVNENYNQRLNAWQMQAANSGGGFPIGGLFSALGSVGSLFSDIRLKTDIRYLGALGDLPIYAYRYIWGGAEQIGVMAQDMLELRPGAVVEHESGFLAVDYGRL